MDIVETINARYEFFDDKVYMQNGLLKRKSIFIYSYI